MRQCLWQFELANPCANLLYFCPFFNYQGDMHANKISIACDHAGVALKNDLIKILQGKQLSVMDHGCYSQDSVDYPDYARLVALDIQQGRAACGILVCGSGIGMAIAANRFKAVRAASITSVYTAELARKHNDLNVLCLGARVIDNGLAAAILDKFLSTPFEAGRHASRVAKIDV